ncbi:MAG: putative transcriptional regulator, Crp/Fnr family, partial [Mucilaginibacter sp.]|nr:putative transcriptional regulator, Crp/Fnr family [Mucilaginibacter sp.]
MHPALKQHLEGKLILSSEHEQLVESCFKPRFTKRNEILIEKGSIAKHLFFVVKGCLRIFLTDDNGNESTRMLIFEGNMGTAFPSFILKEPSVASIQSPEPSELLMLSYADRDLLFK